MALQASDIPATVTSPGYPGNYGNNQRCSWVIQADEGFVLVFNIDYYDLEWQLDRLLVRCVHSLHRTFELIRIRFYKDY